MKRMIRNDVTICRSSQTASIWTFTHSIISTRPKLSTLRHLTARCIVKSTTSAHRTVQEPPKDMWQASSSWHCVSPCSSLPPWMKTKYNDHPEYFFRVLSPARSLCKPIFLPSDFGFGTLSGPVLYKWNGFEPLVLRVSTT